MNVSKLLIMIMKSIYTEINLVKMGKPKDNFDIINEQSVIIFSHNSGGGTKTFVNNYIQNNHINKVYIIYPLSTTTKTKRFVVEDYNSNTCFTILPKNLISFLNSLNDIEELLINSLVECRDVLGIIDILINFIKGKNINTILMFHEFLPLCPNYTLTRNFKYCELNCLKNNCPDSKQYKIDEWRRKWLELLTIVGEIRTFDESVKSMIKQIYPEMNNITVIPHKLTHFTVSPIFNFNSKEMRIGVLGKISKIKGKIFLKGFLKYLLSKKQKIYLFGKSFLFSPNFIHTGVYDSKNLRDKLIKYKINVVLFTSICPETFSYVISELMALNIPIVCFNVGAQANRVKHYERGIVCQSMDYNDVYNALLFCYKNYILDGKSDKENETN